MEPTIAEIRKLFAVSRYKPYTNSYALSTVEKDYPAWVVRVRDGQYGVAIPYDGTPVNEDFNEINFWSEEFTINHQPHKLLLLTSENEKSREQFAVFCYSLVDPGKNGELRRKIEDDPIQWWKEWKELVGNSSVDKKPYAVIGELLVLQQLLEAGKNPTWGGPDAASKDIETDQAEYEVKSTISRYGKTVKISSQFQLADSKKEEFLIFNRFEKKKSGLSINSLVKDLVARFGYSEDHLEKCLKKLGYKKGMSSRNEAYALIEQRAFKVDDHFPRISAASFIGGQIPLGIEKIEYTVDLDSCQNSLIPVFH